ncbi:MAG: hypothetical protein OXC63_00090, partial [Aestuariivita sp.]|nr:hypothetical protein [Aestuariivita sp.]
MKIGKARTLEDLHSGDLEKFAKDIEIRAPFVRRRMTELANGIVEKSEEVISSLALPSHRLALARSISNNIVDRARLILRRLKP